MLLDVKKLEAGYGKKQVIYDVSLQVNEKEIVGMIGHNGAGKSTVFKTIFGMLPPLKGQITYLGRDVTFAPPEIKLDGGIYHIPQDQFIFSDLAVKDNLEISYFTMKDKSRYEARLEEVYQFFPFVKSRLKQLAGTLSGGERRILSIAMGLLRQPKLLMLDEPSSGLSPVAFQNVAGIIRKINDSLGTAILLVEQNVKVAFKLSRRVYVMKAGRMILEETGEKLLQRQEWWDLF